MARDKYDSQGTWWRVARAVFPNVRRCDLEDVVARAWAMWMMSEDRPVPRLIGTVARRRVIDAARIEWGREGSARRIAPHFEPLRDHATHDISHEACDDITHEMLRLGASPQQARVASLLARGLSQREIAKSLQRSAAAVCGDVARIRELLRELDPANQSHKRS